MHHTMNFDDGFDIEPYIFIFLESQRQQLLDIQQQFCERLLLPENPGEKDTGTGRPTDIPFHYMVTRKTKQQPRPGTAA